ncbi:ribonuclease T2 isoform X1 [Phascolarctos cinereus]|uniref:Ribonuclease T2 isoform X1 n=2 Tax=Phascolarctos cinereus TaxID=38626 RepID=A0A6P5J4E2_PHACI|nr:ribonuclease T2 isoform X1 [Phascolarctos cinereus]
MDGVELGDRFNTMQPKTTHVFILGSLCLAFYCLCAADKFYNRGNHEWTKLFMVQHWPTTVCKEIENDCRDPPNYWTIHGLWPDKAGECNRSWHFNLDEIKDLLPDMRHFWPDVIHPSPNRSQFWKHEWEKHGTCAAQLDALNSQKKYFGKCLEFYKNLDLNSMLLKLGIEPSVSYYQIADIRNALTSMYGVIPKIQCLPPEQEEEIQTLGQIEFCFTKDLHLRNCTEPGVYFPFLQDALLTDETSMTFGLSVCEDGPVFYPPPEKTYR